MSWAPVTIKEVAAAVAVDGTNHRSDAQIGTHVVAYRIARSRGWSAPDKPSWRRFASAVYKACQKAAASGDIERVQSRYMGRGMTAFWRQRQGGAA